MFRLLPHKEIEFSSPLRATDALARLATGLKPPVKGINWTFSRDGKFMGAVEDTHFEMQRDINYRNGFLPRLSGSVLPSNGGCAIRVRMQMHPLVRFFLFFWLAAVLLFAMAMLLSFWTETFRGDPGTVFIPLLMLAFGIALPRLCFYPEARKAEKFLKATLDAREEIK